MVQFKVPQNIDLQDKIIGPLTMLQFIYLMAGGMIIYTAFELFQTGLFAIIAIPVGILSLSLAFLKIQDQPFSKFLVALIFYSVRPKTRAWDKLPESEKFKSELVSKKQAKTAKESAPIKMIEKSELEKLAQVLDTGSPSSSSKQQGKSRSLAGGAVDIFSQKPGPAKGVTNAQNN